MLNNQITLTRYSIADMMYPVGSYYITESDELNTVAKMNAFFGGTWEQVTGRFLYGSSTAKTEGGSNDAKVISHSHGFTGSSHSGNLYGLASNCRVARDQSTDGIISVLSGYGDSKVVGVSSSSYSSGPLHIEFTTSGAISTVGESATNANMPAYRTVFMYRRKTLSGGGLLNIIFCISSLFKKGGYVKC